MDTYTNSKGETMLIKDMENPHLIHSIAKLAMKLPSMGEVEMAEGTELLKALKVEAIARLTPKEE